MEALHAKADVVLDLPASEAAAAATALLKEVPDLETRTEAADKVQVLVLRGKLKSAIPGQEKEGESDISKALKLKPADRDAWFAMSEVLWRRQRYREARDAAESTLRIAPNDVPALCNASSLARMQAVNEKVEDKKPGLVTASIQRAKQAIELDMKCAKAWMALALALFHEAATIGVRYSALKKALAASMQACRLEPNEGTHYFNRGMIEHMMCHFADAVCSFSVAGTTAASLEQRAHSALMRSFGMRNMSGKAPLVMSKIELKKMSGNARAQHHFDEKDVKTAFEKGKLPDASSSASSASAAPLGSATKVGGLKKLEEMVIKGTVTAEKPVYVQLVVLLRVSGTSDRPLVYMCADEVNGACLLNVSNLNPDALPCEEGDELRTVTVAFPPSELDSAPQNPSANASKLPPPSGDDAAPAQPKKTGAQEKLEADRKKNVTVVFCDSRDMLISGAAVPSNLVENAGFKTAQS